MAAAMTISELADFLSLEPATLFHGNYRNRRGLIGYFVQLQCGEHWVKVSVSNASSGNGGISRDELGAMTKDDLIAETPFPVSLRTIAAAIRHIASRGTEWKPYENAVYVPGVWLEERLTEHWYMVSVSRVEGLNDIPPERLDEPADEFLRRMGALSDSVRPVTRRRRFGLR